MGNGVNMLKIWINNINRLKKILIKDVNTIFKNWHGVNIKILTFSVNMLTIWTSDINMIKILICSINVIKHTEIWCKYKNIHMWCKYDKDINVVWIKQKWCINTTRTSTCDVNTTAKWIKGYKYAQKY